MIKCFIKLVYLKMGRDVLNIDVKKWLKIIPLKRIRGARQDKTQ